jgi:rfaE bifunctional protein kinase chain/domain
MKSFTEVLSIVESFENTSVLTVGDSIIDVYRSGEPLKLSREAPVPVLEQQFIRKCAGGAANVAINIAALGGKSFFCSVVGDDKEADYLEAQLLNHRVVPLLIRTSNRGTHLKERILAGAHMIARIESGSSHEISSSERFLLLKILQEYSKKVDTIVLSDYGLGCFSKGLLDNLTFLPKEEIIIDSRNQLPLFSTLCPWLVKPNFEEIKGIVKNEFKGSDRRSWVKSHQRVLLERTNSLHIAATLDIDGTLLLSRSSNDSIIIESAHLNNANPIGAGDTYLSILSLLRKTSLPLFDKIALATKAALEVLRKPDTGICHRNDLIRALERQFAPSRSAYRGGKIASRLSDHLEDKVASLTNKSLVPVKNL